ncbi:hypothetical protein Daesc_009057 [Daldinia eschscholtzii]|uniref:Uncharacterized protein n=1 Tax=Daldinia eschscholtzii TaxID=292717 RepID=A0AAX6M8L4_9PEZI
MPRQRAPAKKTTWKSLRAVLPDTGMDYPRTRYLLSQPRRDDSVVTELEKAGLIPKGKANIYSTKALDEALAHMFTVALRPEIKKYLTGQQGGLLEFLSALRHATPWAQDLSEPTFIRFCERVVASRMVHRELSSASSPFDPRNRCQTAASIDRLYGEIGGLWNIAEFEVYEYMGGYEDDNDVVTTAANASETSPSVNLDMTVAATAMALDDDVAQENVRQGVRQMNLNPRVHPRAYWFRSDEGI